jgi:hypothetical protein
MSDSNSSGSLEKVHVLTPQIVAFPSYRLLPFVGCTKGPMFSLSLSLSHSLSFSLFLSVLFFCVLCYRLLSAFPYVFISLCLVTSPSLLPLRSAEKIQLMPTGAERSDEPEGSKSRRVEPEENNRSFVVIFTSFFGRFDISIPISIDGKALGSIESLMLPLVRLYRSPSLYLSS